MNRKALVRAVILSIALALLLSFLVRTALQSEVQDSQAVEWGVDANWRRVVEVDVDCYPDEWRNVILFELRDADGGVIDEREAETLCLVDCQAAEGQDGRCGGVVYPVWEAPGETWYKPYWISEERGIEIVSHPPGLTDLDERGFRRLAWTQYFPLVLKDAAPR